MWAGQHEQYYKDTTLRHPKVDDSFEYHDRDLFKELVEPARKRGMKIYPRILEAGPRGIVNFSRVVTVNVHGRPTQTGCWNHPEYKAFWNATAEDLFKLRRGRFSVGCGAGGRWHGSSRAGTGMKATRRVFASIAAHGGRRRGLTRNGRAWALWRW